jgi:hypothetical protein
MLDYHLSSEKQVRRSEKVFRGVRRWLTVPVLFLGLSVPSLGLGAGNTDFLVEMVSPQKFRIQPRISGPVSSAIMGGGGNQTLITRQENGRTVIDAEVPVGGTLRLRVGSRSMQLQMVDSQRYEWWED